MVSTYSFLMFRSQYFVLNSFAPDLFGISPAPFPLRSTYSDHSPLSATRAWPLLSHIPPSSYPTLIIRLIDDFPSNFPSPLTLMIGRKENIYAVGTRANRTFVNTLVPWTDHVVSVPLYRLFLPARQWRSWSIRLLRSAVHGPYDRCRSSSSSLFSPSCSGNQSE